MAKLVSVIVPNWNGASHLPDCLSSLERQTFADFDAVVVDNGSTDTSLDLLAQDYPWAKVIPLSQNLGFAGGCNTGIKETGSEIVVILNNDTEVEPEWLAELLATLGAHPEAGMATPKVRLWDDRQRLHTTGDLTRCNGIPDSRGVWEEDHGQYDDQVYVFGAAGVAPAFRRKMLDEIGLFDADFGSYCEDVDLSWRAQLAGYRCVFAPRAVLYHKVSATGKGITRSFYVARNTIWTLIKNLPAAIWRKHRHEILQAQWQRFADALGAWRGVEARATMRGQIAGLVSMGRVWPKREHIQSTRRVDDAYIESILSPA